MFYDYPDVQLAAKTWPEVRDYLKRSDTIIIPTGSFEQHGPGLPVSTDTISAQYIALQLGIANNLLVGPAIPIGDSLTHLDFPGTIALKPSTMMAVVKDYITSLYKGGFRRFLIVNGHADNQSPLLAAFSELGEELQQLRYDIRDFWDFSSFKAIMLEAFNDPNGGHADATDASMVMAIDASLVHQELFTSNYASVQYRISRDLVAQLYTTSGVINADQSLASKEIGVRLLKESIKCYNEVIQHLQR